MNATDIQNIKTNAYYWRDVMYEAKRRGNREVYDNAEAHFIQYDQKLRSLLELD